MKKEKTILAFELKTAFVILAVVLLIIGGFFVWKKIRDDSIWKRLLSNDPRKVMQAIDIICEKDGKFKQAAKVRLKKLFERNQVRIPDGSFLMGSNKGRIDERPIHKVYLDAFYMDRYEVSNIKYYLFIRLSGYKPPPNWRSDRPPTGEEEYPVHELRWEDANAFCEFFGFKLPTEAQWEKACRAESTKEFPWGDKIDEAYCWVSTSYNLSARVHPVGQKKPNRWGLYDMIGNADEYCRDWYRDDYYWFSPKNNPENSSGLAHVARGGDAIGRSDYGCARRNVYRFPSGAVPKILSGFRCVRKVECPPRGND